jgi:hypothetical protein
MFVGGVRRVADERTAFFTSEVWWEDPEENTNERLLVSVIVAGMLQACCGSGGLRK